MENAMKNVCACIKWISLVFFIATASYGEQAIVVLNDSLKYEELEIGTGETAEAGRIVRIHFTGWLDDNGNKGNMIYTSREHGKPVVFKVGTDMVIKAWNIGVVGMKAGGIRRLMTDSEMAYGVQGSGEEIPPNSDIIFEIELLEVKTTEPCSR
jgi:FKBP-type peptidyl-prolyl cis-trans isomerase